MVVIHLLLLHLTISYHEIKFLSNMNVNRGCILCYCCSQGARTLKSFTSLFQQAQNPAPQYISNPNGQTINYTPSLKPGVDKTYFLKRHIHYNHTAYIRDSPLPPTTHFQLLICGSVTQKKTLLIAFNLKWTASSFQQSSHRKWSKNLHCVLVEYTNANILDTFIHKDQLTLMR